MSKIATRGDVNGIKPNTFQITTATKCVARYELDDQFTVNGSYSDYQLVKLNDISANTCSLTIRLLGAGTLPARTISYGVDNVTVTTGPTMMSGDVLWSNGSLKSPADATTSQSRVFIGLTPGNYCQVSALSAWYEVEDWSSGASTRYVGRVTSSASLSYQLSSGSNVITLTVGAS